MCDGHGALNKFYSLLSNNCCFWRSPILLISNSNVCQERGIQCVLPFVIILWTGLRYVFCWALSSHDKVWYEIDLSRRTGTIAMALRKIRDDGALKNEGMYFTRNSCSTTALERWLLLRLFSWAGFYISPVKDKVPLVETASTVLWNEDIVSTVVCWCQICLLSPYILVYCAILCRFTTDIYLAIAYPLLAPHIHTFNDISWLDKPRPSMSILKIVDTRINVMPSVEMSSFKI
jgi:hypothetical protein